MLSTLAGWYELVLSSILHPPSSLLSYSSFIMPLVNERPGHNKTSHATHSHQQSDIPSRAPPPFIGHNKHKWCPAFAQTFAASGCLNTGLLPSFSPHLFPLTAPQKRRAEHQRCRCGHGWKADRTWWRCEAVRRFELSPVWKHSAGLESGESAQAFHPVCLLLTRPERDSEACPRHPSSRVLPEQRHRPSITVSNSFLFVFLFLYFCRRQHRGPTRDLRLGAPRNGLGILFIHVLSPSSGRLWLSFPTWN